MLPRVVVFVIVACAFVALPEPASSAEEPAKPAIPDYRPVAGWPQMPDGLKLGAVSAVATDAADRVYVFHRGKQPILVFDRDGKFVRSWGDDLVKSAHGLRIDHEGNVWVTDIGNHLVMKFDAEGKLLLTLGEKGKAGNDRTHFNKPTDIAITPGGDFYVSDGYGNARVIKFSKDGKFLMEWGSKGTKPGEFNIPHAIRLDRSGRVYVGDRENNRIQVFDADGKFSLHGSTLVLRMACSCQVKRIYVADGLANWMKVLDLDGKTLGRWGEKGTGPGQFNLPHGVCIDSHGIVYVAEITGQRVQKFVPR